MSHRGTTPNGHCHYSLHINPDTALPPTPQTDWMMSGTGPDSLPLTALMSTLSIPPTTAHPDKVTDVSVVSTPPYLTTHRQSRAVLLDQPTRVPDVLSCCREFGGSDDSEMGPAAGEFGNGLFGTVQCGSGGELWRKERRRAQNRRAAQRCRAKRKRMEAAMMEDMEREILTMHTLEMELRHLTSQKRQLEMTLAQHGLMAPRADDGHEQEEDDTLLPLFCLQ